ncbi:MAG TPA: NAD(P)H-hydrate dehydratase [Methanocorpusculum sp.]|nr:NAD(P)H-hydrate dehydratase [Methanocorpusculum sp.]
MNIDMKSFRQFCLKGVVSSDTMRAIDKNSDAYGVLPIQRMEAAGAHLAQAVLLEIPSKVLFLCGSGNNGGDGFTAARYLSEEANVSVIACGMPKTSDAAREFLALKSTGADIYAVDSVSDIPDIFDADVIVDCLLGTGARLPLKNIYEVLVNLMNCSKAKVIACDMPTPGARADRIISFHLPKTEGAETYDIGIPKAAEIFCGDGDLLIIPSKSKSAHKGAGGTVLIVGGGPYQGAPFLAGIAALRAGADIVRVASPSDGFYPDIIHERLSGNFISESHREKLLSLASKSDVCVCGPGLGTNPESLDVVRDVISASKKAVVDADMLRNPLHRAAESTIFTPHLGEFERCFGVLPKNTEDRGAAVRLAAKKCGGTVILKGETDVISDGKRVKFNMTGVPSLTSGGTGDVLAGTCGALLCRMNSFEAACAAVYGVCKAGAEIDEEIGDGMLASDLLRKLSSVLYKVN